MEKRALDRERPNGVAFVPPACEARSPDCASPPGHQQQHERRKPRDARAIAIVRIRQRAAHEGVGEDRERDRRGENSEIAEARPHGTEPDDGQQQHHRGPCDRHMQAIDRGEVEFALLLTCGAHGRQRGRREPFDHAVGVPDAGVHAVAGAHAHKLFGSPGDGGLDLQPRILDEAVEHDRVHFVVHALETAEPVEHALAPEEHIGVVRQLVAMRAKLQTRIGTMIVEIARDDAGLQHAAERDGVAARRPGELAGHRVVRGDQHQRRRARARPRRGQCRTNEH